MASLVKVSSHRTLQTCVCVCLCVCEWPIFFLLTDLCLTSRWHLALGALWLICTFNRLVCVCVCVCVCVRAPLRYVHGLCHFSECPCVLHHKQCLYLDTISQFKPLPELHISLVFTSLTPQRVLSDEKYRDNRTQFSVLTISWIQYYIRVWVQLLMNSPLDQVIACGL